MIFTVRHVTQKTKAYDGIQASDRALMWTTGPLAKEFEDFQLTQTDIASGGGHSLSARSKPRRPSGGREQPQMRVRR